MALLFCDHCRKQFQKDSYGAEKHRAQFVRLCDNCSMKLEKFLDDALLDKQLESILRRNAYLKGGLR